MNYLCRYCGKEAKVNCKNGNWFIQYQCNNHNINVLFEFNEWYKDNIRTVLGSFNLYYIDIYDKNDYMELKTNTLWFPNYKIPKDNNLTPENFEQKLKLYYTFM